MRHDCLWGLAVFVILASIVLTSCHTPTDGMPTTNTYWDLNIVQVDGSGHKILAHGGWEALPTDSAIIFAGDNFSLFIVKYDGSNLTQLYPSILWGDHALSPNGEKVLLASGSFESSGYLSELYLMDPDGTNLVKLAPAKGWYAWPRISPDLDEVVFFRDGGIATINTDGTSLQHVKRKTDSTHCLYGVYIDENDIVYFEDANSLSCIRLFNRTSREDRLIGSLSAGFPAFGRVLVGSNLLFADLDTIKILNVYTSALSRVGLGFYASFSSDGSKIVGSDGRSIYIMDSDGTNQERKYTEVDSEKSISFPQFSPDGRFIVFQTAWTVTVF